MTSLARDPSSGEPIQNTPYGREWVQVRATGTIPNTQTQLTALTTKVDVSSFSVGCFFCKFTKGSLTSGSIYAKFADSLGEDEAQMCVLSENLSAPTMTYKLLRVEYLMDRDGNFHFVFPLPCAKWMTFYTTSVGTVTNSDLLAWIGLGNGSPFYRVDN